MAFAPFFDLKEFYPVKRRVHSAIAELLRVHHAQRNAAWLMLWCRASFGEELALKHYLRIERRLGQFNVQLAGKWEMSDVITQLRHHQSFLSSELFG